MVQPLQPLSMLTSAVSPSFHRKTVTGHTHMKPEITIYFFMIRATVSADLPMKYAPAIVTSRFAVAP